MKGEKKSLGNLGEALAKRFLEEKAFILVERNYRQKFGEIDLIMKKNGEIFFIEVKAGFKDAFIDPLDHLTKDKIKKFERVGEFYLDDKKIREIKNRYEKYEKIKYYFWAVLVYFEKENKKAEIKIIKDLTF